MTLARDLLIRAAQDPEQPIPVVFPLSSWAERRRPLTDWLVDALNEQYDVPRKTGQAWVNADQVLPLLDGLDEVQAEHRTACAEAINTFRQDHGLLPLVVCSRVEDYEVLRTRLRLQGAVAVQPLTREQVDSYLAQIGQPMAAVRETLHNDPTLWELLETPLMLTVTTLAYAGASVEVLRTQGTPVERRQYLFAAYVDRMFQRRRVSTRYTRPQTEHWLAWLAWQMAQHSQTMFYLERMQPDWLLLRQCWVLTQGTSLLIGLGCGLLAGLCGGLVFSSLVSFRPGLDLEMAFGLLVGLLAGLSGGLAGYSREITSIETVRWSASGFLTELFFPSGYRVLSGLRAGLVSGTVGGLIAVLVLGLWEGLYFGLAIGFSVALVSGLGMVLGGGLAGGLFITADSWLSDVVRDVLPGRFLFRDFVLGFGLFFGAVFGLLYKLSAGLAAALSGGEVTAKTRPNEGIHRSARMAVISGLGGGLVFGILDTLSTGLAAGLVTGLFGGLITGIRYGGRTCVQHLLLRLGLRYHGFAPWQYANFLDYAAERIFLRKVGCGYSFIHQLLQDYFATRYSESDDGATQEPAERASSTPS